MTPIPSFIPLTPLPTSPEGYRGLATDRVLRHFAVTCAERAELSPRVNVGARDAILAACRDYADGRLTLGGLQYMRTDCWQLEFASDSAAEDMADVAAYKAALSTRVAIGHLRPVKEQHHIDQQRLFTLHIGKKFLEDWSDESIAVSRWSPDWRTEATANLAEQIATGNFGLAGVLADELQDKECDNHVWLRILRECPEIIRPGMWFWDRLRGIVDAKTTKVEVVRIPSADLFANAPSRTTMG